MSKRYSLVPAGATVSASAAHCWEFGLNPDVEELKRYNLAAKKAACAHPRAYVMEGDDWTRWHCPDCTQ